MNSGLHWSKPNSMNNFGVCIIYSFLILLSSTVKSIAVLPLCKKNLFGTIDNMHALFGPNQMKKRYNYLQNWMEYH